MRFLAIGDVHASGFGDDPLVDNLPARLTYIKRTLDYCIQLGKSKNINEYVILGDLIHDKTIIYNIAQSMLYEFFKNNTDCHFTIISGNHDLSSTGENQKSAIEVFDSLSNVHCVVKDIYCDGTNKILFVPYTNDFIGKIKNHRSGYNIIVAHVGLNEAVLQSGLSKVDKLKITDIKDYKLAILGHYHKPQEFGNDVTKVYYAGSLIPRDWNDKNESKRVLIVDTDSLNVENCPIPDSINVPRYIEIVIPPNSSNEDIKNGIEEASIYRKQGHHVRLINKNKTKIKEDISDVIILEQHEIDVTNRGITVDQTKIQQCEKYLEIKQIPEEERKMYMDLLKDSKLLETVEE